MNKTFKILEIFWLVIAFAGVLFCVDNIVEQDRRGSIFFLIFTLMAGVMYAVRKRQRKKYEASEQQKKEQKK